MTLKKRTHIIDPTTLRARLSANDNAVAKKSIDGGSGSQALKRSNKLNKPRPASQTRQYYGLPDPSEFSKPGLLASVMDQFLAQDAACDDFHHRVVRNNIVGRYQHALDLANDAEAFAAWKLEPRILGLSRKPKCDDDVCAALFRASHRDPKTASKRWKRIEHFWKKRAPASAVATFLATRKPQNPLRPKEKDDCSLKAASRPEAGSGGSGHAVMGNKVETHEASTAVHVGNLPLTLISKKQIGDFVALGGMILEKNGNRVSLQLTGCG